MDNQQLKALVDEISTWDQAHLDRLIGTPAIEYARKHDRDTQAVANAIWSFFPFGPKWFLARYGLRKSREKSVSIVARANAIMRGRADGTIVVRNPALQQGGSGK